MRKKLWVLVLSLLMLSLIVPSTMACGSGYGKKKNKVTIIRDNYGVPHVFAKTKEGLAFGAGYAMAQDRLWQADLYRRSSFGSLAEFGFATIDQDYQTRTLGYSKEELLEIFENWEPSFPKKKLKEMTLAYVDGINLYITEALTALSQGDPSLIPIEYLPGVITPDGLPLEYFSLEDSVAIVVMMAWRFGATGGNELAYSARYEALKSIYGEELAWDIFNDLYPQVDPGTESTIPDEGAHYPKYLTRSYKPSLPNNIGEVYQHYEEFRMGQTALLESMGLPTKFGSNAWMVNPWKSKSGNAMQVGGPQMGHSTPQIVLEIGFHGAGINAVGMMMPHAPTILIGVSDYGAWTSTTGGSDTIDTFMEVVNPENPTQYLFNGEWVDMERRTETIYGYKKLWSEDRVIYRTVHGPIVVNDSAHNMVYTMGTPFYKNELAAEEGWSLFQQSRNLYDMQEACKRVDLSHNFYWVDKRGNIGYWHSGAYPIKPEFGKDGRLIDDRFPLWGTGEEEWVGVTGFDEMPKCVNPDQGYLANWNNKPISNWPYAEVDWGEGHRVKRIQELLEIGDDFTFEDMNSINMDAGYNHIPGMNFLHYLVEAASTSSDLMIEAALPYLQSWDHHYNDEIGLSYPDPLGTYDDPGLTIFDAWYDKIFDEVFDEPGVGRSSSLLIHVFDGEDSKLALNYDYLTGEDKDEVINRALKKALVDLEAAYGPDISMWLTAVGITYLWSQGALPTPKMHAMNRGTYNHIVEMPKTRSGRWKWHWYNKLSPHAVNVIPPGQSGFFSYVTGISPHAFDQLSLYDTWTYKPVLFKYRDIKNVAESTIVLTL
ncbi:MAG: penicillin acylase family protein [Candidatus Heimdallarchaeota archaeon]